jgi:hypothetical protein
LGADEDGVSVDWVDGDAGNAMMLVQQSGFPLPGLAAVEAAEEAAEVAVNRITE